MAAKLTRNQSLNAKPIASEIKAMDPKGDGKVLVTVEVVTRGMQRWLLRLPPKVERRYELDTFGLEVLEMCDGKNSVKQIAKKFAKSHQLGEQQAQRAVIEFIRNMITKGLVAIMVPE